MSRFGRELVTGDYWVDLFLLGVAVNGSASERWAYLRIYLGPLRSEGKFLCFEVGPGSFEHDRHIRPRMKVIS